MSSVHLNFKYDKITEIMDKFIQGDEEGNPFEDVILSGFIPKKRYYLRNASVILEPVKYDSKIEYVSLSAIKKDGLIHKDFFTKYYYKPGANPLIVNRYLLDENETVYIKAQCSDDRNGFYKEYVDGLLIDEKNYGDCSCYFRIKEMIVYPEGW